jgi:hypothetical protein
MYPRKPLPHADQVAKMKALLRRCETELKHRYNESFEATGRKRDCPLEVAIRSKRVDQARDLVGLAKACLEELRRQEAMFIAPFKPGDRIVVERQIDRKPRTFGPYLITDVRPAKRGGYRYEVAALVKSGRMHKRDYGHWISIEPSTIVKPWTGEVCAEGEAEAQFYRQCAETSRTLAFERGDLSMFEAQSAGYLGGVNYRRRDRLRP